MDKQISSARLHYRLTPWRVVFLALGLLALTLIVYRGFAGLGAPTNLNDYWPWGLWKAVFVFSMVPLAAAGFVTVTVVYIFNRKDFQSLTKRAVVIGMLGYGTVMFALLLDLGLWYNFWRPFIWWGYTSILFEVIVCLTLYFIILVLEFSPAVLKHFNLEKLQKSIVSLVVFFAIAGTTLSFFHQSSLGGLFLIAPYKMNVLWYSEWLPWYFIITAVAVGPAFLALEVFITSRTYKQRIPLELLSRLTKISATVFSGFILLRLYDLAIHGKLALAFAGTFASNMFLLEMALFIGAAALLSLRSVRESLAGLVVACVIACLAVIVSRSNVLLTSLREATGGIYVPHWQEWAIAIGVLALVVMLYQFIIENFDILSEKPKISEPAPTSMKSTAPSIDAKSG